MHILAATDLSDGSIPALRWAFDYAHHLELVDIDVELTVLHAAQARYPQVLDTELRLEKPENREELRREVENWTWRAANQTETEFDVEILAGRPDKELRVAAERHQADWLAVGMAGHGALAKLVVGSSAERLAHGPPCNLAICHPRTATSRDSPTFVVGIDFTDACARALEQAATVTRQLGGLLHIAHVVEPPTYEAYPFDTFGEGEIRDMEELIGKMQEELDGFIEEHEDLLEDVQWASRTLTGYPTRELVGFADEDDLDGVFLGTAGRSAVGDFLIGSVSRGVVKHMPCSIYLTPPVD